MKPAATAPPAPMNCSGATAEAGGGLRDGANDKPKLIVVADAEALAQAAAERVMARNRANPGRIAICLTGGSSPKRLYQLLGSDAWREQDPVGPRALVHR